MSPEEVCKMAQLLRDHAERFEQRDWDYTRHKDDLKHIRYGRDWRGYDRVDRRFRRGLDYIFPGLIKERESWLKELRISKISLRNRFRLFLSSLKTDKNLPDGVLDGGGILVYWEETAEYLQFVQPSVGSRIADLMEQDPSNPWVVQIALEMKRIQDRYSARVDAGEVE